MRSAKAAAATGSWHLAHIVRNGSGGTCHAPRPPSHGWRQPRAPGWERRMSDANHFVEVGVRSVCSARRAVERSHGEHPISFFAFFAIQVRRSCKCDAACFVPTFADAMATRRGACSPSLLAYNDTLAVVRWGAEHTSHHRSASASSPFRDLLIASATRVLPAHLASAARGRGRQRGV